MPAGRPRKPLAMQTCHLTAAEKAERRAQEEAIRCQISAEAPDYLDDAEIDRFYEIADLLTGVDEQLCTALDADQLARYVTSEKVYIEYTRSLRKALRDKDFGLTKQLQRQQDIAFRQVQTCASALGLNVSSRLKFDLRKQEAPKVNKFADGLG